MNNILQLLGGKRFMLMSTATNYTEYPNSCSMDLKTKKYKYLAIDKQWNGQYIMEFTGEKETDVFVVEGDKLREQFQKVTGLYIILN